MRLALTTGRSCSLCCSSPLVLQWVEPHSPLVANLTCSLFPCGVRIAGRSSFRRITSCSSCDRVSNWEMRHRGEHTHPGRNRTVIRCEMCSWARHQATALTGCHVTRVLGIAPCLALLPARQREGKGTGTRKTLRHRETVQTPSLLVH